MYHRGNIDSERIDLNKHFGGANLMRLKQKFLIIIICLIAIITIGTKSYLMLVDNGSPKDTLLLVLNAAKTEDIDVFIANSYDKRIPNGSLNERRKFYQDVLKDMSVQIDTYEIMSEQVISKNTYSFLVQIVSKDGSKSEVPILVNKHGFKWRAEFGEDIKG
jgi:hypothetical protein